MAITVHVAFSDLPQHIQDVHPGQTGALKARALAKNSEEVPSCFVSVCAKISSCFICLGEDFPRVLRPQTSSQRAISWKMA